ncbi:g5958 [Coccomyxa elongata]
MPSGTKNGKRFRRTTEAVSYEALQAAGFDAGPSLKEASEEIGKARKQQIEKERIAAEEAARKQQEEEAAEEAARLQRRKTKHQSPADSLQEKEKIVTHAEVRGAALRAAAAAQIEIKHDLGQALDVSTYAGAAKRELERKQARERLPVKRQHKDS